MAILIPLDRLADNPWQTRQAYDQDYIENDLAVSIARSGLLQTPVGRLAGSDGKAVEVAPLLLVSQSSIDELLASNPEWCVQTAFAHNRRRAFDHLFEEGTSVPGVKRAGHMPVELRLLDDEDMAEQALIENDKSRSINAVEEALAYQRRIDDFGYTHKDMAERYGKRRATISNKLRLLKLPRRLLDAVASGSLSERSAGAFVPFFTLAEPLSASVAALEDERWKNGKYQNYVVLDQLTDKACREGIGAEEVRHTFERLVRGASEKLEHFVPDEVFDLEGVRQAACQGCALLLKQKDRDEVNYRCGDPACFALKDEAATEAILKAASEACGLAITTCQDREQTASFWTGGSEAKLAKKLLKKGCPHDKLYIRISRRSAFTVPGHDQAELCCLHKGQGCPCQNPKAKASAAAQETKTGRAKARLLGEERYAAPALVATGQAHAWMILSAKWGLIAGLGECFSPYDVTLSGMTKRQRHDWCWRVLRTLVRTRVPAHYRYGWALSPLRDRYVFLAGRRYRELLLPHLDNVSVPMQGLGIGQQLAWLSRNTPPLHQAALPLL